MKKLRLAKDSEGKQYYHFWCPGCDCFHGFNDTWTLEGGIDNPTVNPSLLSTDNEGNVCHMYIKKGQIHYLSNCTHSLAGQILDMREEE